MCVHVCDAVTCPSTLPITSSYTQEPPKKKYQYLPTCTLRSPPKPTIPVEQHATQHTWQEIFKILNNLQIAWRTTSGTINQSCILQRMTHKDKTISLSHNKRSASCTTHYIVYPMNHTIPEKHDKVQTNLTKKSSHTHRNSLSDDKQYCLLETANCANKEKNKKITTAWHKLTAIC